MIHLSKKFRFSQKSSAHCCAMVTLADYSPGHHWRNKEEHDYLIPSATGLYEASFKVGEPACEEFFTELMDKLELLYMSPLRKNSFGNELFTCIFSAKDKMEKE